MKILKIILNINYIILFINIIYIDKKNILFNIKNVDYKFYIFNKFSYKNISYFLNKKYIINFFKFSVSQNIKNNNSIKKKVKIYFSDFNYSLYRKMQIMKIKKILREKFDISINRENPDYLFYNVFGCEYLNKKYKNAIKIAYYTENQLVDFNIADYAVGQANLNYLDRYLKIPYVIGYYNSFNNSKFLLIRKLVLNRLSRKKFCAAVISNYHRNSRFRLKFIYELDKYKKVDMGGRYNNNIGRIKDKILFLSNYKFSIAMENSEGDGYFSEKIIDSFLAGTIPIYYGNYLMDEYINPKSYILIRGENDMKDKIEYIKKIDNNVELYKKIMKENILIDLKFNEKMEKQKYEFLHNIFEQDKYQAKRVDKYVWKNN